MSILRSEGLTRGLPVVGQGERADMRGVNRDSLGRVHPRVAGRHYDVLKVRVVDQQDDAVLVSVLSKVSKPDSDVWQNFMATRYGKRTPLYDDFGVDTGLGEYTVEKGKQARYVPPWERYKYGKEKTTAKGKKVKTYSLIQTLEDTYVRDKYDVSVALAESVRNLALNSPADAAATMQHWFQLRSQHSDVEIRVVAASYSSGSAAAVRDISMMAKKVAALPAKIPSFVTGELFYMMSDDPGDEQWMVKGPLAHAATVRDVYRLACVLGKHETVHMFSAETAKLQIDIFIGSEVVSPNIVNHSRAEGDYRFLQDSGVVETLAPEVRARFDALKVNVMALCDGRAHRASAVRLTQDVVMATQHVFVELKDPSVEGASVKTRQVLGEDLWAFRHRGLYEPWSFRSPVKGEWAAVMYHDGEGVALSAGFKVARCDGSLLLSDAVEGVYPGMSGGAVVSLEDMSLLGVHSGAMLTKLKATLVTETTYHDVCEFVTEDSARVEEPGDAWSKIAPQLHARGLAGSLEELVQSLVPVTQAGVCIGMAIRASEGGVYSVLSPGTYEVDEEYTTFEPCTGFVSVATTVSMVSFDNLRVPTVGESVFLLAVDSSGPMVSEELRVEHVGPYGKNFVVSSGSFGESLEGAAVVSLQDGCVLGLVVKKTGRGRFCVNIPPNATGVGRDVARDAAGACPRFTLTAWEPELLAGVLDHVGSQDVVRSFAELGRSVLRAKVTRGLLSEGLSSADLVKSVDLMVGDGNLAGVMDSIGLVRCMSVDDCDGIATEGQKAMSFLAFLALASENETVQEVDAWLDAVGLSMNRPSMSRRPSGFNVLSGDGRVLRPFGD